jgi:tetratricopeptide (TPR) repeat protein
MGRRLDPLNTDLHSSIVETLSGIGRHEEALAAVHRANDSGHQLLDPMIISLMWEFNGDAERAWQNLLDHRDAQSSVYYNYLVHYAVRTRDHENVRNALDQWPESLRRPQNAPEAYELARAKALSAMGRLDESRTISLEIQQRMELAENPYPEGWQANAIYHPMDLPGLLGDLEGVQAAWADFEANHPPDAWAEVDFLVDFADAFIRAGDPESAIDRLQQMITERGPWTFLVMSINPALDGIRTHPRYLELKAQYEEWATNS